MCPGLLFLKYHFSVSYIIPPFWWKLPNFSTELSVCWFFFLLLGTDGMIFISNSFNVEIVISNLCRLVQAHPVSYISMKGTVCSLCSVLRCQEDTISEQWS